MKLRPEPIHKFNPRRSFAHGQTPQQILDTNELQRVRCKQPAVYIVIKLVQNTLLFVSRLLNFNNKLNPRYARRKYLLQTPPHPARLHKRIDD